MIQLMYLKEFLPSKKEEEALLSYVAQSSSSEEKKKSSLEILCECEKYMLMMLTVEAFY